MKILLHTCCAPCSIYCIEALQEEKIDITTYWYNPNIHPYMEYKQRLDTFKSYMEQINIPYIIKDEYGLREFTKNVINDLKNRCANYCYKVRLEEAAKYAKQNGYDAFSTTLLVSPYQNHEMVKQIGEEMAKKYGIEFLYRDFRVGFRSGQNKAKQLGLYMQKYCGCIFSEHIANDDHKSLKPIFPEGYEPQKEPRLQVKKIENKEDYMNMFLEADPSENMIHKYLNNSDVYALKKEDEIICIAVILPISKKVLELKNIVTKEEYRGKGYAKILLKSLCGNYKQKYDKMLVGTTENNIPFYVKQGFDKYEKTIKNFFVDNYEEEIKDGDLVCTDMIYYSKDLKKR